MKQSTHDISVAPDTRIAVGTLNPVKLEAVRSVLREARLPAEVRGISVESGVPEQPWGDEETLAGALQRARAAREAAAVELGVGIESGVAPVAGGLFAFTWAVIVSAEKVLGRGCSARLELPPEVARRLRQGEALESAMEALFGTPELGRQGGAMGLATAGRVTRLDATRHALHFALASFPPAVE